MTHTAHPNLRPIARAANATVCRFVPLAMGAGRPLVEGKYGDLGRYFTAHDGHVLFIPDPAHAGHVPAKLRSGDKADAKRFTRGGLESALIADHDAHGGGFTGHDDAEAANLQAPFVFRGKGGTLPEEIGRHVAANPALKRIISLARPGQTSGGEDAMAHLGEQRYLDLVTNKATGRLTAAKAHAANSPDPEVQYLNAVHDNLPERRQGDPKGAKLVPVKPGELRVGAEFTAHGVKHRVAEDADGFRVLRHGSDYGESTPLDLLRAVPVDEGSFRQPRPAANRLPATAGRRRPSTDAIPFSAGPLPNDALAMAGWTPLAMAGGYTDKSGVSGRFRTLGEGDDRHVVFFADSSPSANPQTRAAYHRQQARSQRLLAHFAREHAAEHARKGNGAKADEHSAKAVARDGVAKQHDDAAAHHEREAMAGHGPSGQPSPGHEVRPEPAASPAPAKTLSAAAAGVDATLATTASEHDAAAAHHRGRAAATTGDVAKAHGEAAARHDLAARGIRNGVAERDRTLRGAVARQKSVAARRVEGEADGAATAARINARPATVPPTDLEKLRAKLGIEPPATRYDAGAAGTSTVKPGLFGQPTLDPMGSRQSADLFHKPVDLGPVVPKRETVSDRAAAKRYDPTATPMLPGAGATRTPDQHRDAADAAHGRADAATRLGLHDQARAHHADALGHEAAARAAEPARPAIPVDPDPFGAGTPEELARVREDDAAERARAPRRAANRRAADVAETLRLRAERLATPEGRAVARREVDAAQTAYTAARFGSRDGVHRLASDASVAQAKAYVDKLVADYNAGVAPRAARTEMPDSAVARNAAADQTHRYDPQPAGTYGGRPASRPAEVPGETVHQTTLSTPEGHTVRVTTDKLRDGVYSHTAIAHKRASAPGADDYAAKTMLRPTRQTDASRHDAQQRHESIVGRMAKALADKGHQFTTTRSGSRDPAPEPQNDPMTYTTPRRTETMGERTARQQRENQAKARKMYGSFNEALDGIHGGGGLAMAAGPFKYASTQVNLPHPLSTAMQRFAASIPDEHLAKDGREGEPHVTVRYGLTTDDPADAQEAMRKPMRDVVPSDKGVRLGKLSLFPATDKRPSDVLKMDVDSPYLHHLNWRLKVGTDHVDTQPTYTPHATVAYLKPGMGKLYAGREVPGVTGRSFTPTAVHFCHKTGGRTSIPLAGEPLALAAAGGGPSLSRCPKCNSADVTRGPAPAGGRSVDSCARCGAAWVHKPGTVTADRHTPAAGFDADGFATDPTLPW